MAATPILDLEQLPPAAPNRWRPRLWGVAVGIVVAAIPILADQGIIPDLNWPAFNGLLLLPALLMSTAIHEMAHAVAGRLAGLETGGISIGPMLLLKSGNTWHFRFQWRSFTGGFFKPLAGMSEIKASHYAWMVAAGPFTSFLLAAVCWVVIKQSGSGFWNFTGTLFWTSLFLGFVSGIPYSYGLQQSDGARIGRLLRHPEQFRQLTLMLTVQTEEANGVRPKDWSQHLCDQMLAVQSSAPEYLGSQLLTFYRLVDLGDEWAALTHLENALSKSGNAGKELRPALFLEAASACARIKRETDKAKVWPNGRWLCSAGRRMLFGPWMRALPWRKAAMMRRLDSGARLGN
jgi:hypothetical protein